MPYSLDMWWYAIQCYAVQQGNISQSDGGLSPLLDGLVAYWKLNEGSGTTRIDSAGSNNLTDNNTVGSATGQVNNAASFVAANNEYLSLNNFAVGSTISAAYWIKLSSLTSNMYHFSWGPDRTNFSVVTLGTGSTRFYGAGSNIGEIGVILNNSNWYFVYVEADPTTNTLRGTVNDFPLEIVTDSLSPLIASGLFSLGALTGSARWFDGLIDEFGIWSRALTATERTQLYNSGSGLTYPF